MNNELERCTGGATGWRAGRRLVVVVWLMALVADPTGAKPAGRIAPISSASPLSIPANPPRQRNLPTAGSPSVASDGRKDSDVAPSDVLLIVFNALLALFTFLLWRATAGLWKATKGMHEAALEQSRDLKRSIDATESTAGAAHRSAEIAERTLQVTQRPTMTLEGLSAQVVGTARRKALVAALEIVPRWKNTGATFATDCALEIEYDMKSGFSPPKPEATPDAYVPNSGSVGPGSVIEGSPLRISIEEAAVAYATDVPIFILLDCRYRGVIVGEAPDMPHRTSYCYVVEMGKRPSDWAVGEAPAVRFKSYADYSLAI